MDDYLPASTFWFTLAVINAGLAEQKDRSRLNWFLISIFLGPFATVLVVAMGRPDPGPESVADRFNRYLAARKAGRNRG